MPPIFRTRRWAKSCENKGLFVCANDYNDLRRINNSTTITNLLFPSVLVGLADNSLVGLSHFSTAQVPIQVVFSPKDSKFITKFKMFPHKFHALNHLGTQQSNAHTAVIL